LDHKNLFPILEKPFPEHVLEHQFPNLEILFHSS
jgi:hypothetical protein